MGMNSLMHKTNFIEKVIIELYEEYLEINLVDKDEFILIRVFIKRGATIVCYIYIKVFSRRIRN